jgi:hypothetical protein
VAIADLNGDGRLDLAVANTGVWVNPGNTVSVLLGNGDGTFGTHTELDTGLGPNSVAIADLNADGQPDLIVANFGPYNHAYQDFAGAGTVSVLLGNGDGTFAARTDFGTGKAPFSLAIADLNSDGRPDIVAADAGAHGEYGNTVSVLLGNGDGTLENKTDFQTAEAPYSVAIADLNADGLPDLALACAGTGEISVLLNTGASTTGVVPPSPAIPLAFALLVPRPNPSLGSSEIQFLLPSNRPVQIDLFDVAGRRVWSWASRESMSAGQHTITWDGRVGAGTIARNGLYFLKLRAGRDQGVTKLIVQR